MAKLLFESRAAAEELRYRLEQFNAKPRIDEQGSRVLLEFTDLTPQQWRWLREGRGREGEKLP